MPSRYNNKLATMLHYQEQLNNVFDPQWRVNRHAYLRAASVESGEMIEHHGYKWWKAVRKDVVQMQLELVDIIHFYLSEVARIANDPDKAREDLLAAWAVEDTVVVFDNVEYVIEDLPALEKMDLLMGLSCAKRINWSLYRAIMKDAGLSFDSLYSIYAAKNVLNLFRQNNGDKQGTYIKVWSGREDNLYLEDLMKNWVPDDGMELLYQRLGECYAEFA
ncbi:hypothetical protein DV532_30090 (plasmid) [Pseudomonas sp. Leaf58]|uniref:dUTP diphosphatase n=2 Tax=Pseudomonas TaxID=286 RepID=UPI0009EB4062|nr:dUTP diphosphatase [Pseudomonas sp. Leaf58]AYG48480.1 hypothetical protein DV532_30090 [Pseudomonas sp. Leaf58]